MRDTVKDVKHSLNIVVAVLNHDLEWSEKFSGQEFSLLLSTEVLKRHLDGSRLVGSVHGRNGMILERHSSEQKLSSVKFEDSIDMGLNSLVVPGKDGYDREVIELSLCSLHGDLLNKVSLPPVSMHEQNRLGRALLTTETIGVVVTLPSNVVDLSLRLGDIWSKDLPVESSVFELHLAVKFLHEVLTDVA